MPVLQKSNFWSLLGWFFFVYDAVLKKDLENFDVTLFKFDKFISPKQIEDKHFLVQPSYISQFDSDDFSEARLKIAKSIILSQDSSNLMLSNDINHEADTISSHFYSTINTTGKIKLYITLFPENRNHFFVENGTLVFLFIATTSLNNPYPNIVNNGYASKEILINFSVKDFKSKAMQNALHKLVDFFKEYKNDLHFQNNSKLNNSNFIVLSRKTENIQSSLPNKNYLKNDTCAIDYLNRSTLVYNLFSGTQSFDYDVKNTKIDQYNFKQFSGKFFNIDAFLNKVMINKKNLDSSGQVKFVDLISLVNNFILKQSKPHLTYYRSAEKPFLHNQKQEQRYIKIVNDDNSNCHSVNCLFSRENKFCLSNDSENWRVSESNSFRIRQLSQEDFVLGTKNVFFANLQTNFKNWFKMSKNWLQKHFYFVFSDKYKSITQVETSKSDVNLVGFSRPEPGNNSHLINCNSSLSNRKTSESDNYLFPHGSSFYEYKLERMVYQNLTNEMFPDYSFARNLDFNIMNDNKNNDFAQLRLSFPWDPMQQINLVDLNELGEMQNLIHSLSKSKPTEDLVELLNKKSIKHKPRILKEKLSSSDDSLDEAFFLQANQLLQEQNSPKIDTGVVLKQLSKVESNEYITIIVRFDKVPEKTTVENFIFTFIADSLIFSFKTDKNSKEDFNFYFMKVKNKNKSSNDIIVKTLE